MEGTKPTECLLGTCRKFSLLLPRVIQCHLPHQLDHWTPAEKKTTTTL